MFQAVGPTREAIFTTLFGLLQQAPGFVTYSRRWAPVTMVPPDLQPALLMRELPERSQYQLSLEKRTFTVWVYGYARVPPAPTSPGDFLKLAPGSTIINPLMDAVEDAIEPPPGQPEQQLRDALGNPQVAHVRFTDTIKEAGDADPEGQAFFVFELNILIP